MVRVHQLVPEDVWSKRYGLINDFEHLLRAEAGTTVAEVLPPHLQEEQLASVRRSGWRTPSGSGRSPSRTTPSASRWDEYVEGVRGRAERDLHQARALVRGARRREWARNLMVARVLADTLQGMDIQPPEPAVDLHRIRAAFHEAAGKPGAEGRGEAEAALEGRHLAATPGALHHASSAVRARARARSPPGVAGIDDVVDHAPGRRCRSTRTWGFRLAGELLLQRLGRLGALRRAPAPSGRRCATSPSAPMMPISASGQATRRSGLEGPAVHHVVAGRRSPCGPPR